MSKWLIESANDDKQRINFYLSANTAIIGASAYIATLGESATNTFVVAVAGIGVCILWQRNIDSYKTLNEAKFKVINQIEKALPLAPFTAEWSYLDPDGTGTRHRPFHVVEVVVPRIFICVHIIQAIRAVPWGTLLSAIRAAIGYILNQP